MVLLLKKFFYMESFFKIVRESSFFFYRILRRSFLFKASIFEIFKDLSFYIKGKFSYFKVFIKFDIPYKYNYSNLVNK